MDRRLDGAVMQATAVLLAAGVLLVAAGTAGAAASLPLVIALVAVGGALYLLVERVDLGARRADVRALLTDVWLGPFLGAAVAGFYLGASPGEVQALGGIVGLVGMLNYFLRPFYHLLYGLARRVRSF